MEEYSTVAPSLFSFSNHFGCNKKIGFEMNLWSRNVIKWVEKPPKKPFVINFNPLQRVARKVKERCICLQLD